MKKTIYFILIFCTACGIYFTKYEYITTYLGGNKTKAKIAPGMQWKTDGLQLQYGPAVAFDGNIYVGKDNSFYSFSGSGSLNWEFTSGNLSAATPVIGKDSGIYSFSPNSIFKFSKDGKEEWRIDAPIGEQYGPQPLVTEKGFFVTRQNNGERRTAYKDFKVVFIEHKGYETELVDLGKNLKPAGLKPLMIIGQKDSNLVLEHDKQLLLVSMKGEIVWQVLVQDKPKLFVIDSLKENVVVASKDEVRAYKIGSEQLWAKIYPNTIIDDIQIRDSNELVINNNNLELLAFSVIDGQELWKYNPNIYVDRLVSVFESKMIIDKNKDIFLFYNNGELLKLHAWGEVQGQWKVGERRFLPGRTISQDGIIYVLDETNNLCAVSTAVSLAGK